MKPFRPAKRTYSNLPTLRALAVVIGLSLCAWPSGQVLAEPSLVSKAKARREASEQRLTTNRAARLAERARLTRRLQEAYARLANAEGAAERAEAALQDAERDMARGASNRARAAQRAQGLARLLGQAADLRPEDRNDEPAVFIDLVKSKVRTRLARLDHDTHIHTSDAEVLGRDGRSGAARVFRVGRVTALAVDSTGSDAVTGFLQEPPGAPAIIVGPRLDPVAVAALRTVEPGRQGALPLDIDGALTRVTAEPPRTADGIKAGGVFVWPILGVGLLGLLLFAERFWYFVLRPVRATRVTRVTSALAHGDQSGAQSIVTPATTDLDRVLTAGIQSFASPRVVREQALETALLREEPALERGLSLLGAVAGLAPLLGLLGTVTGMITTFDVISTFGTGNPRLLSGGISVALITTQLGLVVAVPALLAHAWVSRAVSKRQALLEEARTALLSIDAQETPGR